MRSLFLSLVLILSAQEVLHAQGSGQALSFNGNSFVDLDTSFTDLNFPVTITFWLKASGTSAQRVFSTNSNTNAYAGIRCQFNSNGNANFHFGTGGGFTSANRRSINTINQVIFNEWTHFAYVINSSTSMAIYVNGVQVPGSYSGSGGSFYQPTGTSSFGRAIISTGNWAYLTGSMDDFSIWDKALNATEIRDLVCRKANPITSHLLGYFDFDNPVANSVNSSINGHIGSFGGSVTTPPSGASIGDTSYHAYPPPATFNQTLSTGEQIVIKNLTNGTEGIQVFEVQSVPNSLNGLPPGYSPSDYFGVFLARTDNSIKTYELEISAYTANTKVYRREANDSNNWSLLSPSSIIGTTATFTSNSYKSEYVVIREEECRVNLGTTILTCYPVSIWLKDQYYHPSKTYFWSTGVTGDSLLVTNPGIYYVQLDSLGCIQFDSIEVIAQPVLIDLGPDQTICSGDSVWVKDLHFSPSKSYVWNGTQTADSIKIGSTQVVIVEADSAGCAAIDTFQLTVEQYSPPVFETTLEKCIEEPKIFSFLQGDYSFLWPDGSTKSSFEVDTQRVVLLRTISPCNDTTVHTLNIIQNICDSPCKIFVPNSFTPNEDGVNDDFQLGTDCIIRSFKIRVFNRWGAMVYESNDPDFQWDGSYNGKILSDGVYIYTMEYTGYNGDVASENGLIHLHR